MNTANRNEQIEAICSLLEQYMKRNPELRFGQALVCVSKPSISCLEFYDLPDEKLHDALLTTTKAQEAAANLAVKEEPTEAEQALLASGLVVR